MICDPGERYLDTYYNDAWLAKKGLDIAPFLEMLERFEQTGQLPAQR
jgi:cysteine synthase